MQIYPEGVMLILHFKETGFCLLKQSNEEFNFEKLVGNSLKFKAGRVGEGSYSAWVFVSHTLLLLVSYRFLCCLEKASI